jgi:carbamoyltransferase
MIILGIHNGHDCGAAIVKDGKIISAVNEERVTRDKLSFGVPFQSVKAVLDTAGIRLAEIDHIAMETIAKPHWFTAHALPWVQRVWLTKGTGLLDFFYIKDKKLQYIYGAKAVPFNLLAMTGLPRFMLTDLLGYLYLRYIFGFDKPISLVSHHHCHAASAYYTSGFSEALSFTAEEYDGHDAVRVDSIRDCNFRVLAASAYPHSPGVFYSLITRMLGYNQLLHAGKITGLAAYADPAIAYPLVEKLMWSKGMQLRTSPLMYQLIVEYARTGEIPNYFGDHTREELSAAFQQRLEDTLCSIAAEALKQTGFSDVVLSGGVTANVKLNQRIFALPQVKRIFVHPGMTDCGTAVGAALWLNGKINNGKPARLDNVFLGHEITDQEARDELDRYGLKYSRPENMAETAAEILDRGKIIARVAGKMEYGPRALGNRSILYHCQDTTINAWLNARLNRTEFMPFAPAVLAEEADRCFIDYQGAEYTAEFMTITFDCTDWLKEKCPAVVHLDGTARPQLVTKSSNPGFYDIIEAYAKRTGIPVLINTSYNIHNEPIAMTAADAISIFKRTCLDYLILNSYLVSAAEDRLVWKEEGTG